MEEETGVNEVTDSNTGKSTREEIYTKIVRAGRRTYFFDIKATRKEDYYLTITESKKRLGKEGKVFYEKHKIFLYREDFEKFSDGLKEALAYIYDGRDILPERTAEKDEADIGSEAGAIESGEFTNIEFDDLGTNK